MENRMVIDGKKLASDIISDLKKLSKPNKILAAILVGSTGSPQAAQSKSFLRQKELMAKELGIVFELFQFGDEILEEDLISEIKKIGADPEIGGLIVQLPLPPHFNRDTVLAAINPKQDIDALTPESQKFVSPLPVEVVKDILQTRDYELKTKVIAVVGRGFLVGKPMADWLRGKCKELIIFHSKSDLSKIREADLVITAVGKGGLIKPEMLKPGAGVIDFGYSLCDETCNMKHETDTKKIHGDLDVSSFKLHDLSFYTPTPGGTGPILVAEIFKNFYKLNSL
ncbi:MAG: bifunctional 5,10-methylenetetrahydrofolate dehydrogenase/5,10-methenyltetrahydrofolate cyclohydrolase [Candidatus Harrisonbacteria bacterium]|nr:bifunctional 5,10-methylenetetrahydrofolate dehydrogenase/5,10-methenyltetrahydrofolate cyclohydrolase [Candidatus Harrisonbacteria bacterium]